MSDIDWHKILVAYIAHVKAAESIDFVTCGGPPFETAVSRLTNVELLALHSAISDAGSLP